MGLLANLIAASTTSLLIAAISKPRRGASLYLILVLHTVSPHRMKSGILARLPSALFASPRVPDFTSGGPHGTAVAPAPVALFTLFPLEFRCALEERGYAQAQCLSIWGTVLFPPGGTIAPARGRAALYGLSVVAGLSTHAHIHCSFQAAHFAWLLFLATWQGPRH
jgi:hypothetical protein